jgi:hypothetical protein
VVLKTGRRIKLRAKFQALPLRRRGILHFALHRRDFILLFYGVSEIFLRPHKVPYEILL